MKGPAPKSKKTLAGRVSWRADGRPDDLVLDSKAPKKPSNLKGEASKCWDRVVPILAGKGVLSEVDRDGLVELCRAWAEMEQCDRLAARRTSASPEWRRMKSTRQEAFQRWQQMAQRFGLTPADRTRVKVPDSGGDKSDKVQKYFTPRMAGVG